MIAILFIKICWDKENRNAVGSIAGKNIFTSG